MAKELPPPDGVEQLPSPRRYVLAEGVPVALAIMTSPVRVTGVVGAVPPVPVTYTWPDYLPGKTGARRSCSSRGACRAHRGNGDVQLRGMAGLLIFFGVKEDGGCDCAQRDAVIVGGRS